MTVVKKELLDDISISSILTETINQVNWQIEWLKQQKWQTVTYSHGRSNLEWVADEDVDLRDSIGFIFFQGGSATFSTIRIGDNKDFISSVFGKNPLTTNEDNKTFVVFDKDSKSAIIYGNSNDNTQKMTILYTKKTF